MGGSPDGLLIPIEKPSANRFAAPKMRTMDGFNAAPATPETTAKVVMIPSIALEITSARDISQMIQCRHREVAQSSGYCLNYSQLSILDLQRDRTESTILRSQIIPFVRRVMR